MSVDAILALVRRTAGLSRPTEAVKPRRIPRQEQDLSPLPDLCQRHANRETYYVQQGAGPPWGDVAWQYAYEDVTAGGALLRQARAFVKRHHYSGTAGPGGMSHVHAMFRKVGKSPTQLVGVAIFTFPPAPTTTYNLINSLETRYWGPFDRFGRSDIFHHGEVLELTRFVLLDAVPYGGEVPFLADALRSLRQKRTLDIQTTREDMLNHTLATDPDQVVAWLRALRNQTRGRGPKATKLRKKVDAALDLVGEHGAFAAADLHHIRKGRSVKAVLKHLPFLATSEFTAIERSVRGVLSFSDPVPIRVPMTGKFKIPGHIGNIYQAQNAIFVGQSVPGRRYVAPNGQGYDGQLLGKIARGPTTKAYGSAMQRVIDLAGPPKRPSESDKAYVARLRGFFHSFNHPGNFAYTWPVVPSSGADSRKFKRRYKRDLEAAFFGVVTPEGRPAYPKTDKQRYHNQWRRYRKAWCRGQMGLVHQIAEEMDPVWDRLNVRERTRFRLAGEGPPLRPQEGSLVRPRTPRRLLTTADLFEEAGVVPSPVPVDAD